MTASLPRLSLVLTLLAGVCSLADTHYVDVNSTNPVPPYTNWATAANVIQDAVDAASTNDTMLVTNGVYDTGGRAVDGTMTNRVAVDKPLTLMSVNGPGFTVIQGHQIPVTTNGDGAIRCVYLTDAAALSGFTLRSGATLADADARLGSGGGAFGLSIAGPISSSLTDCVIHSNSASDDGGGVCGVELINCLLVGNVSYGFGGGASSCRVRSCTVYGNSASVRGGGTHHSSIWNSIVWANRASIDPNYYVTGFNYSCSTPLPSSGTGNITNAPLFVDTNSWANLRLLSNSPCINAGNNAYVTTTNDFDGNLRVKGGTVDMGAYEFRDPQSLISYAWLQQYGLPNDGSVDDIDGDGDNATTWEEWKAWTIPTNGLSVLKMLHPAPGINGIEVPWQSVNNHTYTLERATSGSTPFELLQANVASQGETTTFTDTTAANGNVFLYRINVPE